MKEDKFDLLDIEEDDSHLDILDDMLSDLMNVELDISDLEGIKIDKSEFTKGVKGFSKLAGMFACLRNVGMDTESAINLILNERNIEHAQKIQKIINDGQESIAKTSNVYAENHQI